VCSYTIDWSAVSKEFSHTCSSTRGRSAGEGSVARGPRIVAHGINSGCGDEGLDEVVSTKIRSDI
jgi:hypothetical protein